MATTAANGLWCTTCGAYVRPGTHGIHEMSWTGGAREIRPADPETSNAAAVTFVVLAFAGVGVAVLIAGWLLYRAN